jgi:hypothetical protein
MWLDGGVKGCALLRHLNLAAFAKKFNHLWNEREKESPMTAACTNCEFTFHNIGRNEDGSPAIENELGCEVYLCQARCEHFAFFCEGCRTRFCGEHKVGLDGMELCADCAMAMVEDQEPECECAQSDADLFDAAGCEFHNLNSSWNVRLRAVTAAQAREQFKGAECGLVNEGKPLSPYEKQVPG